MTQATIPDPAANGTPDPALNPATPPVDPAAPANPLTLDPATPTPPVAPAGEADVEFEYAPTGQPGLDIALDFVGKQGLGPQSPAVIAAQNGDFSVLEAALKAKGESAKGYEKFVALAKDAYAAGKAKRETAEAEAIKVVHEAAGGEANWKAIQAWAAANADPAERVQINAALAAGGLTAKFAVQGLAALYAKAPKTQPPAPAVKPGTGSTPAATGHITSREYSAEVQKLRNTLGTKLESSAEYKSLVSRRQASRAAGVN